jgi:hypothetical protein
VEFVCIVEIRPEKDYPDDFMGIMEGQFFLAENPSKPGVVGTIVRKVSAKEQMEEFRLSAQIVAEELLDDEE